MRPLPGLCIGALAVAASLGACGQADRKTRKKPTSPNTVADISSAQSASATGVRGLIDDEDDDDNFSKPAPKASSDSYDGDADSDPKGRQLASYYDPDDASVLNYGHAPNASDDRAIRTLVKRYYQAAAAANGAKACRLMYSLYAEAIPEDYGSGAGPAYAHGHTCAVVMSKMYKRNHRTVVSYRVTGVRVNRNRADVTLGSPKLPARFLIVRRERHTWKVSDLFGEPLP